MDLTDFGTDTFSLAGRSAIVTGGNTGLGRAFTVALAKAGADVFVPSAGRRRRDDRRSWWRSAAARYEFAESDITGTGRPARIVDACVGRARRGGHPGEFGRDQPARRRRRNSSRSRMGPDARGEPDRGVRAARTRRARRMIAAGRGQDHQHRLAVLLPRRQVSRRRTRPRRPASSASPRRTRTSWAEYGIQVNAIAPGYFETAHHRADALRRGRQRAHRRPHPRRPLGRPGRPHGSAGVPGQPRLRLRQRPRAGRRRRLPRPLIPLPNHHPNHSRTQGHRSMAASRSALSPRPRSSSGSTELLGADQVDTDDAELREASVDRFKKYTAVHGIFDGPDPGGHRLSAIAPRRSPPCSEFADENLIDVVPAHRPDGHRGRPRDGGRGHDRARRLSDGRDPRRIDPIDMMVTVQCGVPLQVLEDTLRAQGLTTGHSPQSKPLAQYGGLVATRSIGQFSTLYGGIEDMVVGLEAVLPGGRRHADQERPAACAGPDIRHLVIGNEGALCFITEVTIKVFRYQPENNRFFGFLVDDFGDGVDRAARADHRGLPALVSRGCTRRRTPRQHFAARLRRQERRRAGRRGPQAHRRRDRRRRSQERLRRRACRAGRRSSGSRLVRQPQLGPGQDRRREARRCWRPALGYTTEVSVDWSRVTELYDVDDGADPDRVSTGPTT